MLAIQVCVVQSHISPGDTCSPSGAGREEKESEGKGRRQKARREAGGREGRRGEERGG